MIRLLSNLDPALPAGWQPAPPLLELLARPLPRDPSPWAQQRRPWLEQIRNLLEHCITAGAIPLAAEAELLQWWTTPAELAAAP